MDTPDYEWVLPSVVAKMVGCGRDKVRRLPLIRMDVRSVGATRPLWRYRLDSVHAFITKRSETIGSA